MTSHAQPNRFKRSPKAAPKYCELCGEEIRISVGTNGNSASLHTCFGMIQTKVQPKQRPIQKEKLIIDKIDRGRGFAPRACPLDPLRGPLANGITVYIARNRARNSDYPNGYGPTKVIVKGKLSVDPLSFFE